MLILEELCGELIVVSNILLSIYFNLLIVVR